MAEDRKSQDHKSQNHKSQSHKLQTPPPAQVSNVQAPNVQAPNEKDSSGKDSRAKVGRVSSQVSEHTGSETKTFEPKTFGHTKSEHKGSEHKSSDNVTPQSEGMLSTMAVVWLAGYSLTLALSWQDFATQSPIVWCALLSAGVMPLILLWVLSETRKSQKRIADDKTAIMLERRLAALLNPGDHLSRAAQETIAALEIQYRMIEEASARAETIHNRMTETLETQVQILKSSEEQAEATRTQITDATSSIVSGLEAAAERIEGPGLARLIDASQQVQSATQEASSTLEATASHLEATTKDAHTRIETQIVQLEDARAGLDDLSTRVSEVGDTLSSKMRVTNQSVSGVTVDIETSCESLERMIEEKTSSLIAARNDLTDATGSVSTDIQAALDALEKGVKSVSKRGENVGVMLRTSTQDMKASTDESEARLIEVADKLHLGSQSLMNALEGIHETGTAVETAVSSAGGELKRMISETNTEVDELCRTMIRTGHDLRLSGEDTMASLETFIGSTDAQLSLAGDIAVRLEEIRDEASTSISTTLDKVKGVVAEFVESQALIYERIVAAVDRVEESSNLQHDRVQNANTTLRDAVTVMTSQFGSASQKLGAETDRLTAQFTKVGENSRSMLNNLEVERLAWGQATEASGREGAELILAMKTVRESIIDPLQDLYDMLGTTGAGGDAFVQRIGEAISTTSEKLTFLDSQLGGTSAQFLDIMQNMQEGLDAALKACDASISSTRVKTQDLLKPIEDIETASQKAEVKFRDMTSILNRASTNFDQNAAHVKKSLTSAIDEGTALLNSGLETTETVIKTFNNRLAEIEIGLEAGQKHIVEAGETAHKHASSVARSAEQASGKLNTLAAGFERRKTELSVTVQEVESRMGSLFKTFEGERERLAKVSGEVGSIVDQASSGFRQQTADLSATADIVCTKFTEATEGLTQQAQALVTQAGEKTEGIGKMATWLGGVAEEQSSRISTSGQTLVETSRLVLGKYGTLSSELEEISKTISETIEAFLKTTESRLSDFELHGKSLSKHATELEQSATVTVTKVDEARGALLDGVQGFGRVGKSLEKAASKLLYSIGESTHSFSNQVEQLNAASLAAAECAERVAEAGLMAQQEQFFDTARFLVESLNSIAVDISRLLESDIPEKIWEQLARGESAVFTRRLAAMRKAFPVDDFRKLYQDDVSFRNYVLRFISEYEQLVTQAATVDRSDVLQSLFRTSDLGKVYLIVCSATHREPNV